MSPHVTVIKFSFVESFATLITLETIVSCVMLHVSFQTAVGGERFITQVARKVLGYGRVSIPVR